MSNDALSRFEKTFGDARGFIPSNNNFTCDSDSAHRCRFALVFAVASMDSYFTKKFTDNLTNFLKSKGVTEDLEKMLKKANIDTKFFLELLRDGDFSSKKNTRPFKKIHTQIRASLNTYTSQSFGRIDSLFKAYEIKELSENAIERGRKGHLKGIREPIKRLAKIVQRRHEIVHANDYNLRSQYSKIDAQRTIKDLMVIEEFVLNANAIIDNKFRDL